MDPFQLTTYQMAMYESGQLTQDELRITLRETIPEMKAVLYPPEGEPAPPPPPQY